MKKEEKNLGFYLNMLYPIFIAFLFIVFSLVLGIDNRVKGYSSVLESVITFSSIIIGFYTAMYGILISIMDSDIFKIFKNNGVEGIFKFQLYDSLITSFIVLFLSIAMQVLKNYPNIEIVFWVKINLTTVFFYIWIFVLGYFIGTSFRSISLLLKLMFKHNVETKSNSNLGQEDKEALIENAPEEFRNSNNEKK
jgi:hypothetical protein